jgi:hypothetical protein
MVLLGGILGRRGRDYRGRRRELEVMYTLCAYCERNAAEVCREDGVEDPEDALSHVVVKEKQVLLCTKCRELFAPSAISDIERLLSAPIDFPPGVTAVEHTCPQLQHEGKTEEEATYEVIMKREGDFYTATCQFCGVTVRSSAAEDFFGNEKEGRSPLPGE